MKKTIIALCGALSLAAFAEPAAPDAGDKAPDRPPMKEGGRVVRGPMQKPTTLVVSEKTTPAEIAAFKAEVAKKVDEAVAAYAAGGEGAKKRPVRLMFFSNEGMGPRPGMGGRGEGRGQRRPRGERKDAPVPGDRPAPDAAPEKPAEAAD